jgi:two-component system, OmpR family, phosphate regulon sensor histidine kinase PhoR
MANNNGWLRAPGRLLILFILVVLLPAATLVGLGVRLLKQDRDLARQRQAEVLERASENGVRVLQQDLAALASRLAGPAWETASTHQDSLSVLFTRERIQVSPPGRIPYFPVAAQLAEPPPQRFRDLEMQEYALKNPASALETARKLADSADLPLRAGALVAEARLLREMKRYDEALAVYQRLSEIRSVAIIGTPADLVARKARSTVFAETSKLADLQREAAAIEGDLRAGRWQLDRETYEQVARQLSEWLHSKTRAGDEGETLAEGVDWLYQRWRDGAGNFAGKHGSELISAAGKPLTILWISQDGGIAAFIAGPACARARWLNMLQQAALPALASLLTPSGQSITGDLSPAEERHFARTPADTGLPWTVMVAGAEETSGEFASRRNSLLAGLVAVLVLVAAGSWFIWRAVHREMAAARLQSDFVAAVSHEFRTPLTTLRQFSEMLVEEEELPRQTQRRYHAGQVRAVGRLQRLVEALLDFGRMEAGRRPYRMEPIDAGALVREVTDEFRREVAERGFIVECSVEDGPAMVQGDAEALGRTLYNLLDNAAKYSGAGRRIEVSLQRAPGTVTIAVRDHGLGIPTDEQRRIFQKFVRGAAAKSAGIQGTGIGLAMVRHIVDAHGGTISVESTPGAGSTFAIVLPEYVTN